MYVTKKYNKEIPFEEEDPSINNVANPNTANEGNPHKTRTCKSGPTPSSSLLREIIIKQISATTIFYTV